MRQNIFVLGGTGNIGRELLDQVRTFDGSNHEHQNPTAVVGVANSTRFVLDAGGVALPETLSTKKGKARTGYLKTAYDSHGEILESIRKAGLEWEVIFVDVTADGERITDFHRTVIRDTANRIVTANKKPVAADMLTFQNLTSNPDRYRFDTTVMAGGGAVSYLLESHALSEEIQSVEGTFSGTLAYICSELEKWEKRFSSIVQEAKKLGYTEPNPIDDLSGEDVRRKLVILLRSSGITIEEDDVALDGFVNPKHFSNLNPVEFIRALKNEDARFQTAVSGAKRNGLVPRYVASYKEVDGQMSAQVGLQFVPQNSDLGNIRWTANRILIHTSQRSPLGETPHMINSTGAGARKTAASVRAELAKMLTGTNLWKHD